MDGLFQYELFAQRLTDANVASEDIETYQLEVKVAVLSGQSCTDERVPIQEYMGMIAARRDTAERVVLERLGLLAADAYQPEPVMVQ